MTKTAVVYYFTECEPIEALSVVDVLRRAGFAVTTLGKTEYVEMGAGIVVKTDKQGKIDTLFDAIVLPGGMGWKNLQDDSYAKELTKKHIDAGKLVCAICAAPAVALGHWGLINGKKATCYPSMETMGLQNSVYTKERVVVDGKLVTAAGPGVSLEFAVEIVKQLGGDHKNVHDSMIMQ